MKEGIKELISLANYSAKTHGDLSELTLGEIEALEHCFRCESTERRLKLGQGYNYADVFGDEPLSTGSGEALDINYEGRF